MIEKSAYSAAYTFTKEKRQAARAEPQTFKRAVSATYMTDEGFGKRDLSPSFGMSTNLTSDAPSYNNLGGK